MTGAAAARVDPTALLEHARWSGWAGNVRVVVASRRDAVSRSARGRTAGSCEQWHRFRARAGTSFTATSPAKIA